MDSFTPHVNYGFQQEEEAPPSNQPPPYAPNYSGMYPTVPQYPTIPSTTINTHYTVTAGQPHPSAILNDISFPTENRRNLIAIIVFAIVLTVVGLVITAVLVWYFVYQICVIGQRCGLRDCSGGTNNSQCFRLYGPNFQLQSFSTKDRAWKPVCSSRWNKEIGRKTCEDFGYWSFDYVSFGQMNLGSSALNGYMILKAEYTDEIFFGESAYSYLTESSTCQSGAVVTLKCVDCGKSTAHTRIVGGDVVNSKTRWPWQVSLHSGGGHRCGGSIIGSSWIVSAAHCFQKRPEPDQWIVHTGILTQTETQMWYNTDYTVSLIITHPDYDSRTNDNDIALMKLSVPLLISPQVRPVCLPNAGLDFSAPRECYITGFGAIVSQGPASNELREARVTLIDRSVCNSRAVYNGKITDSMICAGKLEGGVDSCQGDSGGPLVTQENSLWWLVGDTSWGEGCAARNKPGVYGNVTFFRDWIYKQMQKYFRV